MRMLWAVALVAFALGCKKEDTQPTPPTPSPSACAGAVTVQNGAHLETLNIFEDNAEQGSVAAGSSSVLEINDSLSHQIDLYESYSGDLIASEVVSDMCNQNRTWSVSDPYESEMDVDNETWYGLTVSVDGIVYDTPVPGTYAYPVRAGTRKIEFVNPSGGVLYDSNDQFTAGSARQYSITDPECVTVTVKNESIQEAGVYLDTYFYGDVMSGDSLAAYLDIGNHVVSAQSTNYSASVSQDFTCGAYWLTLTGGGGGTGWTNTSNPN